MKAMPDLIGKRAVITGAASGLGRSLALLLASSGCRLGIADISTEKAERTLREVHQRGGRGEIYPLDVSKPKEVESMAAHFFDAWGGVDLLFNNAGVAAAGCVGDIPLEDWKWIVGINFWGVVYGCHSFIPRMKAQGHGTIVNTASAGGFLPLPEMAPYNASKAAVVSLSETLRSELAPHNIRVTVICPTFFNSDLDRSLRCTDEFEREAADTAIRNARMNADAVARATIEAIDRGDLYVVPQLTGRIHWLQRRLFPTGYVNGLAFLNRTGRARPLLLWVARRGLL
jgi:NAD(P)-dependent dehydrogenase (short-subunit alcohol dehydrogenase family)